MRVNYIRSYIRYGFVIDLQADLEDGSAEHGVLESEHPPIASGTLPEAWMSSDNDRYCNADGKDVISLEWASGSKAG